MAENLFVYGTLLYDEVWNEVVGHKREKQSAKAFGWARYYVNNKLYPGLISSLDSVVDGMLITGLTNQEWSKLDKFEDDLYIRKLIDITLENNTTIQSYAYIVEQANCKYLSSIPWEPKKFKQLELKKFLFKLKSRN